MFEMEGKVKEIFDEQTFGSGFRKREFVLTLESGKYPQDIKFECVQDKIDQLNGVSVEDAIKVKFDIRGREWKGNYFVNLSAWQIQTLGGKDTDPEETDSGGDAPPDDIPF